MVGMRIYFLRERGDYKSMVLEFPNPIWHIQQENLYLEMSRNFIFRLSIWKFRFHCHLSSSLIIQYWTTVSQCCSTLILPWWYLRVGTILYFHRESVIILKLIVNKGCPIVGMYDGKLKGCWTIFSDFNYRNFNFILIHLLQYSFSHR